MENARKYAKAAHALIDPKLPNGKPVNNWYDWLIASLILKEAEQTLDQSPANDPPIEKTN